MAKARPEIPLRGIAVLFILIAPLVNCQQTSTANQNTETAHTASSEKLKKELEFAARTLIAVIEKGEPSQFVPLCSRSGVEFGIDWPVISLTDIQEQIVNREGVYCLLFDSDCLRRENDEMRAEQGAPARTEPLYSYRELFLKASSRDVKVFVLHKPALMGQVSVHLAGGPADKSLENPKDFFFVYEDGKWKLTAVPYG